MNDDLQQVDDFITLVRLWSYWLALAPMLLMILVVALWYQVKIMRGKLDRISTTLRSTRAELTDFTDQCRVKSRRSSNANSTMYR